jgi:hypothetical protein
VKAWRAFVAWVDDASYDPAGCLILAILFIFLPTFVILVLTRGRP